MWRMLAFSDDRRAHAQWARAWHASMAARMAAA